MSTAHPERLRDDSTLLQAVADGDTVAIGSLYDLHGAQCFSLALRLLEEDHEAAEEMRAALGELSVEEKRAIELGYFAAPTSEGIARRTDAFVDTVKGD